MKIDGKNQQNNTITPDPTFISNQTPDDNRDHSISKKDVHDTTGPRSGTHDLTEETGMDE